MKKQFYFLLIFICVNAFSQTKNDVLHVKNTNHNPEISCKQDEKVDAAIRKENKVESRSTFYFIDKKEIPAQLFKYDRNGNVTELVSFDKDGSVRSKVVKEYDSRDNLTIVKSFDKNNGLEESAETKYNEFGNEIERLEKDNAGRIVTKVESIYDGNNNLIEQNSIGSDGTLMFKNVFQYDGNDKLAEKYCTSLNKVISRSTYKYDSNGLMTEHQDDETGTNRTMKYKMKYDGSGNMLECTVYTIGEEFYRYDYTYDKNGNNTVTEYYSKGKLVSILYDTFDENHNKIEEVLKLAKGSVSSKTTYNYNRKNQLTETVYWDPEKDKPTGRSIDKFEYYK